MKKNTFYIIYKLDSDMDIDGLHLLAGYYRFIYDLSGDELPDPCSFSVDRQEWSKCEMFTTLSEFNEFFMKASHPSCCHPMKIERLDYVETIEYRGQLVPVFVDDYGQCFYCIYDNREFSFGSFQCDYEDEVKSLVDHDLEARDGKKQE